MTTQETLQIEKEFTEKNPDLDHERFEHWLNHELEESTLNRLVRAAEGCAATFLEYALVLWEFNELEVCV